MELKIKRLHPDAIMPTYGSEGAACFDLYAIGVADKSPMRNGWCWDASVIPSGEAMTFQTGISFEAPPGYALMIYSRSGHGFKHDVRLCNSVGVADNDFRGEVMVRLTNDGQADFIVERGDRIAQAMLIPVPRLTLVEVDELSETVRGAGGFGSTGA